MTSLVALVCFAQPAPRTYSAHTQIASLNLAAVAESSGLAPSLRTSNTYYTHNDSGDTARFFRFTTAGTVQSAFTLTGAANTDWEDMAAATVGRVPFLYLGDVGDNLRIRSSIRVYRVPEPTGGGGTLSQFQTYALTYPDGAHNAETMMVEPDTGHIWIVEKINGVAGVYRLAAPTASGNFTLTRMGSVQLSPRAGGTDPITGGAISPDGRFVVLRTLGAAYEFRVEEGRFDAWFTGRPRKITLRAEGQGEAICYAPDGRAILTTSEGNPCPLSRLSISDTRLRD